MTVNLVYLKHQLESKMTEDIFNKELSIGLDATILLIEYMEKHPHLMKSKEK